MKKQDVLDLLFKCADYYHDNFEGRRLLIISANNSMNQVLAIEILFEKTNFMHLTGVKFKKSSELRAEDFYNKCLKRRLQIGDFELAKDGTTELKLKVLPKILALRSLGANMIGDFCGRNPALLTEKLIGNISCCIGIVKDSKKNYFVPNTVLKIDTRDLISNRQRIIATYIKQRDEICYSECVYKAKNIDFSRIHYPNEYEYLLKQKV